MNFSIVTLIEEIRERFSYVPGFKRFSLNCMAHAASRYLIIIVAKYTCLWCRLATRLIRNLASGLGMSVYSKGSYMYSPVGVTNFVYMCDT